MPDTSKFRISSKQLVFIILGNTVATGIMSLPRLASAEANQDAWIAVVVGAFAPILVLLLIERLYRKFPGCNFADISCLLFGKPLGTFLVSLAVLYFFTYQAVVLSTLTEVTMIFILPNTPHRILIIVSVLATVYVASHGAQVVARIDEIFMYQFLLLIVLWLVPAFTGDYTNLLPIGGSGWSGLGRGILATSYAYSGMEILLLLYPAVVKSGEVIRAGLTAVGIAFILYFIVTLSCLLAFGSDMMKTISIWPGLTVLKLLEIPGLGRLEIFFLLLWMGFSLRPTFTCHMASSYALTGLWGRKSSRAYLYYVLGLGLTQMAFAFVPISADEISMLGDFVGKLFWIMGVGYPLLFLGTAALRKKSAIL